MYLLVFVTRYLDLFTNFLSMYNTVMKILYIVTAATIVYLIRFKEPWSTTYKKEEDSFKHWLFVVVPCAVLAVIICENRWSLMEVRSLAALILPHLVRSPHLLHVFLGHLHPISTH